jgi:uncharacterized CHY-type Zn-finger protein
MQINKYYCDKCGKELDEKNIITKTIPILEPVEVIGGRGNHILMKFPSMINFKENELCNDCNMMFNQIWLHYMHIIAEEWKEK